jgi:hypothetical protein
MAVAVHDNDVSLSLRNLRNSNGIFWGIYQPQRPRGQRSRRSLSSSRLSRRRVLVKRAMGWMVERYSIVEVGSYDLDDDRAILANHDMYTKAGNRPRPNTNVLVQNTAMGCAIMPTSNLYRADRRLGVALGGKDVRSHKSCGGVSYMRVRDTRMPITQVIDTQALLTSVLVCIQGAKSIGWWLEVTSTGVDVGGWTGIAYTTSLEALQVMVFGEKLACILVFLHVEII